MPGDGIRRFAREPVADRLRGLLQPPLIAEQVDQRFVGRGLRRWAGERPAQLRLGFLKISLEPHAGGEIAPDFAVLGRQLGCTIEGCLCLGQPSSPDVQASQQVPGRADVRSGYEASQQVLNGLLRRTGLDTEKSQSKESLTIVRPLAEHASVGDLGCGEAAGFVGRSGVAQHLVGGSHGFGPTMVFRIAD